MILGRGEILKLVKSKKLIENFDKECLEGAGYDLRVGKFYSASGQAHLGKKERKLPDVTEIHVETLLMKPGDYVLIETIEKVRIPADLVARVLNRSSLFRCGASTFNALIDPGYEGTLTFGLRNISEHDLSIEKGARVAQIVFEEVEGETELYKGRYQGGKVA